MTRAKPPHTDHLLLRRATALLLETYVLQVVFVPLVLLATGNPPGWTLGDVSPLGTLRMSFAIPLAGGLFCLFRDSLFGGTSPGKRLVGLRVVRPGSEQPPSLWSAALRNLPLVFSGLGWVVEVIVANKRADRRRIGDRMADTQVVEANPKLQDKPWMVIFVATWLGGGAVARHLQPLVLQWLGLG